MTVAYSTSVYAACVDFPSHTEIEALLFQYEQSYSHIAAVVPLGKSVESRSLLGLRISNNPVTESVEPEIRIIGGIHGNECQSVDEVLVIMDWLLTGYGVDDEITEFVDGIEFLLVPLVNPDGYSKEIASRTNANLVDLNRNFGFGWSQQSVKDPFSEPESRAIRNVSQGNAFVLGLSYHTKADYVNGSWNYIPRHPRDDTLIDTIGYAYSGSSDYQVVFGWDWYQISGDVNDWSLGTQGTFDWTIELTNTSDPVWDIHQPALRSFFSWAFAGVSGVVTDRQTGVPLHAMITIEPEGEPIFSDAVLGDYHRILLDGEYEITAWAPGYRPLTNECIVKNGRGADVNFKLKRDATFTGGFQINEMTLPRDISNSYVAMMGYKNSTIVSDALGVSDGYYYSIGEAGTVTIDMGARIGVTNEMGDDFVVVSGTQSDDMARVYVATNQDGPFTEVAFGSGDLYVDLETAGVDIVRFIKVVDESTVDFSAADSGYDLDAIENISWPLIAPPSGEVETDRDSDKPKQDSDTLGKGTDSESDSNVDHPDEPAAKAFAVNGCSIEGIFVGNSTIEPSLFSLFD